MSMYRWEYKFKFDNLLIEQQIKSPIIDFYSPHYPSTEKGKNYTEGHLSIELKNLNYSVTEVVIEGLELIFSLTNHINLPCHIEKTKSPPGLLPALTGQINGYITHNVKNADIIPDLWDRYERLLKNNYLELTRSIRWYMRSIKSDDPIDKFIYAWITFNMLYSWLTDANGDNHKKGIKGLTGKGIPSSKKQKEIVLRHNNIFLMLAGNNLTDRCGIDRAKKLRDSLPSNDPKDILEGAIDAIGFIRHNIFHGSLVDKTTEAERCIWPLMHLNSEIIMHKLLKIQ